MKIYVKPLIVSSSVIMVIKDYSYYSSYDVNRNRSFFTGKKVLFIFLIFAIIISSLFIKSFLPEGSNSALSAEIISPLAQNIDEVSPTPAVLSFVSNNNLDLIVNKVLEGTKGEYAVTIINLKTAEQFFLNEHEKFESASLYKLWVMGAVYQKIEQGTLILDKVLSTDIENLNDSFKIATESAEKKEGTITLSVQNALQAMITRSDNYSALLLAANVRLTNVQKFLNDHGLTESKVGTATLPPTITAYDAALFLNKLYNGEFANVQNSENMLALLKGQVLNSKLPKLLPKNTIIGHKTGELGSYSHDAGIVFEESGDYIIVVLTKTSSPKDANEKIAQISKGVYDYFNSPR